MGLWVEGVSRQEQPHSSQTKLNAELHWLLLASPRRPRVQILEEARTPQKQHLHSSNLMMLGQLQQLLLKHRTRPNVSHFSVKPPRAKHFVPLWNKWFSFLKSPATRRLFSGGTSCLYSSQQSPARPGPARRDAVHPSPFVSV